MAWGGGKARRWRGTVRLSQGHLDRPRLLGIEADEPGSIWENDGQVHIAQPTPRTYDGFDVAVRAAVEQRLIVELIATDDPDRTPKRFEVPLANLLNGQFTESLDADGNRLFVRRTPGDALRVELQKEHLVFSPHERFRVKVQPQLLGVPPGTVVSLSFVLRQARGGSVLWSHEEQQAAVDQYATLAPVPLEVPLPAQEGVYDLEIVASSRRGPMSLGLKHTLAQRSVQLVVVAPSADTSRPDTSDQARQIVEIDPVNPTWWRRFDLARWLPGARRGPVTNGKTQTIDHTLGQFVRLSTGGDTTAKPAWQAYPLPITEPGKPHVLELEYPSDVPQTMGISIVEPNAAGAVTPIAVDSGVYVDREAAEQPLQLAKHRLVFWPQTRSPVVLITNRQREGAAVYGRLRVLQYQRGLPAMASPTPHATRRIMAYMARPLFTKNFSASETLDPSTQRSFEDWVTFYEGASRLIEYLKFAGYNGLMLTVYADGSSLYPSRVARPTPRFDRGVFFSSGQDPARKDVVELLMRLCDREGIEFVAALEFSGTLPTLEAAKRRIAGTLLNTRTGATSTTADAAFGANSIDWVDTRGRPRLEVLRSAGQPLAASYNILREDVQAAMAELVREFAERYGKHRSFGGIAIQMAAHGFAHFPPADWLADAATLERFCDDAGIKLPAAVETMDGGTWAQLFATDSVHQKWLDWRAGRLAQWHERLREIVVQRRKDASLYLACADLFSDPTVQRMLQPELPRSTTLTSALRRLGIDVARYAQQPDIVLLRPYRVQPTNELPRRAVALALNHNGELDEAIRQAATPASQFFEVPDASPLPSFDAVSPFSRSSIWMLSQFTPSGPTNRRRLARSMAAIDPHLVVDGGWLLMMGQEEANREALKCFRQLPARRFQTIEASTDPVVIRTYSNENNGTYIYLVNDSPWPVTVELETSVSAEQAFDIFGRRDAWSTTNVNDRPVWHVRMEPYGFTAGVFSEPGVRVVRATLVSDNALRQQLAQWLRRLEASAVALEKQPALDVLPNAGFEPDSEGSTSSEIPGWHLNEGSGVEAQLDVQQKHAGRSSLRLRSQGSIASVVSEPFASPATGRLSVWVWLRVADASQQPKLRIAVEKAEPGSRYYRYAVVGRGADGSRLSETWRQYVFHVDDLGNEGPCRIRVRFDLMGAGEVWFDDVTLYDRRFHEHELRELTKIIAMANVKLQAGELADCYHVLQGYWPQFLMTYVAIDEREVADRPEPQPHQPADASAQTEKEEKRPKGILGRINRLLPKFIRF